MAKNTENMDPRLDQILSDTQEAFRAGLSSVEEWSGQAREFLKKSPGSLMTAAALTGFIIGSTLRDPQLTRRELNADSSMKKLPFKADPLILFAISTVAGLLFGPKFLHDGQSDRRPVDVGSRSAPIDLHH